MIGANKVIRGYHRLYLLALCAFLTACTPKDDGSRTSVQPSSAEDPAVTALSPPPPVESEQSTAAPTALLANGGFEQWTDGKPLNWRVSSAQLNEPRALRMDGGYEGDYAIRLKALGERLMLSQSINLPDNPQGKRITCTAYVKGSIPANFHMRLAFQTDGEAVVKESDRTEGAEWNVLTVSEVLPSGIDPGSARIFFLLRNFVSSAVFLDAVDVQITED